jgi:ABC-type glycerol-3-phosphate transport system permease component
MKRLSLTMIINWILVAIVLLLVLFPFYWMINTSLKNTRDVFHTPPKFWSENWTIEPYVVMWTERPIGRYLVNSIVVAVCSTALSVALSSLAAYGVTRFRLRWEQAFIILLLFTQMLPGTLLVIPYFKLMSTFGLINNYLSLILAYVSFVLPFCTWMLIGFFRTIPRELDEAGLIDGCSRIETYWRVILPLSAPGLVAVALFTFLVAWNAYVWALVLTTDPKMFVLSVGVANMVGEYQVQWNQLTAASVLAVGPVVVIYIFLERYLVAGLTAGAVKG